MKTNPAGPQVDASVIAIVVTGLLVMGGGLSGQLATETPGSGLLVALLGLCTVALGAVKAQVSPLDAFKLNWWLRIGTTILIFLGAAAYFAPPFVSSPDMDNRAQMPLSGSLLGTDMYGVPIIQYAMQGAQIVMVPALAAGAVVGVLAVVAGVSRCAAIAWTDTALQGFTELVGALPRLVVVLVLALVARGFDFQGLMPIAILWALLSAPGAMDEASATAERLGGSKFVEALRAHGFSAVRIYLYHIVWLNLRAVITRQAAEVGMQVIFLEIALSYLAASQMQPSFTHPDSNNSWAKLLYDGYTALVGGTPMLHAMGIGLALVALVAFMAQAFRFGARAR